MASLSEENYNPEEYLLDTLDDLDIGFVKVGNDSIILNHNLTFNKIFGYNPEESLIDTKILDYWLSSEESNKFREILFKNGIVKKYITPAKKFDGKKIFLQLNFKLNKNSNGEVISSEGTFFDISERIKNEQKLKESEEKWRAITKYTPDHIWVIDTNYKLSFVNYTIPELSVDEVIGNHYSNFVQKEYLEQHEEILKEIMKTGKTIRWETGYLDNYGKQLYFDVHSGPIFKEGKVIGIVTRSTDITERKKVEQKLKESEEKYRTLFESSKDGILFTNIEGKIMDCNQTYLDMLGYTLAEIKEFSYQQLTPEKWHEMETDIFNNQFLPRGYSGEFEKEYIRKDKKIVPISINVWLIKDDQGNNKGMWGIVRDISERKQADETLKASELMLRKSQEIGKIGNFEMTLATNDIVWSDQLYKLFGLKKEGRIIDYEKVLALIHPDDRERAIKASSDAAKERKPYTIEHRVVHPDGRILDLLITGDVIRNEKNEIVKIGGTVQDITERKKKEDELRLHSEIMNNISEGVYLIRLENLIIVYANPRFEEMFGYEPNEMIGKYVVIVNAPTDKTPEEIKDEIMGILKETGEWHGEVQNIKKDGTPFWCYANVSLFDHPEFGRVIVSVHTDITERKKKEMEIINLAQFPSENPYPVLRVNINRVMYINKAGQKLLNVVDSDQIPENFQESVKKTFESNQISESEATFDRRIYSFTIRPVKDQDYVNIYGMDITERKHVEENLKEVNKLKSEFLRRASHELKTPLISIKGFSDLILSLYSEQLDTGIVSKLEEINNGCERLQNLINNLLKTSRLESAELKPKLQKEDLSFLIKFCVHELESLAETRKQSIKLDIDNELYANIEKEEIHDVLSNLLTNAIKYTPPNGKIEIKTELKKDLVVVSVKDNGIGFTKDQKTKIFQQFGKIERYGQGLDLGIDGTGLGLYISKRIVKSHGGKIWMESEGKSRGSTFYFTLQTVK
ncbi:MAG: Signal transduction histidine kinase [Candidatus Lokiarchaeum sp. GC14_75]|nr:MAG: Signal transduction histidine kinase [Candidatus Lokiarchaeum sp. GC14_75]